MKQLFLLTVPAAALVLTLAACDAGLTDAGDAAVADALTTNVAEKTDLCHKRDDQGYMLISVADASLEAHELHGDGAVGDPVPGQEGFVFDDECVPVEDGPTVIADCPNIAENMTCPAAGQYVYIGTFSAGEPYFVSIADTEPSFATFVEDNCPGYAAALASWCLDNCPGLRGGGFGNWDVFPSPGTPATSFQLQCNSAS